MISASGLNMSSELVLILIFWMIMGWMLIMIHNQDTNDDLSPLVRDARPGELRYKYYATQFARSLLWPVAFAIVSVILVPAATRYLREPIKEGVE